MKKKGKSNLVKFVLILLIVLTIGSAMGFVGYKLFNLVQDNISSQNDKAEKDDGDRDEESNQDKKNPFDAINNGGIDTSFGGEVFYEPAATEVVVEREDLGYVIENQLCFILDEAYDIVYAKEIIESQGLSLVGSVEFIGLYQVVANTLTPDELQVKMDNLLTLEGVLDVTLVRLSFLEVTTGKSCTPYNDDAYDDPENAKHYNLIGMENAWKILKASGLELNAVKVGVLDTKFYIGSKEFSGLTSVIGDSTEDPEVDTNGNVVDDGLNHGTMVSQIIGADGDNDGLTGIASILGNNLEIEVKNLFDNKAGVTMPDADSDMDAVFTSPSYSTLVKEFVYMKKLIDSGATVINCSFGQKDITVNSNFDKHAYTQFMAKIQVKYPEVIFVGSAGNSGKTFGELNGLNHFPGGFPADNIITVGALNNDGTKADFSNHAVAGGEVTLSAPAVNMMVGTDANGKPIKASGTSLAAPQVTATIALLKSINPKLTAIEIKKILKDSSTTPVPAGLGAGMLNVEQAVLKVVNDERVRLGLSALTLEDYLDRMKVDVTAESSDEGYIITASIPSKLESNTDLLFSVEGDYELIDGDLSQSVNISDEAKWTIKLNDEKVKIKITRQDTQGCSTLSLPEGEFAGKWDVSFTITDDTLTPVLIEYFGEMMQGMIDDMGCEATDPSQTSESMILPKAIFNIVKVDEAAKTYTLEIKAETLATATTEEDSGDTVTSILEGMGLMNGAVNNQGELVIEYAEIQEGVGIHLNLTCQIVDDKTIQGSYRVYLEGDLGGIVLNSSYYIESSFIGTRIVE